MKKILKNSLLILILCFYFFPFTFALAQAPTPTDYAVLTPLPGTTNCGPNTTNGNCTTNLGLYLPQMFNLVVAIAAGLAFVMITLGGITYATTDAIMEKSQGKEWVTNAIYGLLLVISAYVILYTINPQILDFKLKIDQPVVTNSASVTTGGTCSNCVSFSPAIPTKPGIGTQISPTLNARLVELTNYQNISNISWQVTEGYPPSYTHADHCHSDGTCIDANFYNTPMTAGNIYTFAENARKAGLSPTYEVKNQATYDFLLKQNTKLGTYLRINAQASAAHFHIESQ